MVYVVVCGNWQDYEGGGDEVISIHASRDGALKSISAALSERGRKPSQRPNREGRWFISGSPSEEWLEILKYELLP